MKAALLLLALPFSVRSQSVSSCGAAGDHMKDVKITLSPDPIQKGSPFTVDLSGNLDADLTSMIANIDLNIKALGIIDKPVKLSSPLSVSPGLVAGAQTVSVGPVTLPSLPGSVQAVGTIKLTNDKKEPVACINLNLNVPAEAKTLVAVEESEEAQGSKVSVCSAAADHLHSLAWTTNAGVTTVTGSLDEAVTKLTVNTDLTLKIGFLSHKIDLAIPISYSPGFVKGDLKITAGPTQKETNSLIDVEVTGKIKINDGSSQEIACLSIDPATKVDQPHLLTV